MNSTPAQGAHFILLAHGSRDSRWRETLERGLASIRPQLAASAHLAYMEMARPSLEEVVEREYAGGARRFVVLPLFLAAGRHLLTDVPLQIESLQSRLGDVEIDLHEAIGQDDAFWQYLLLSLNDRLLEVMEAPLRA